MKFKIDGIKYKFKKANAQQVLIWLSGIVHTVAAAEKNQAASLRDAVPLTFAVPAVVTATDCDIECSYVEIDGSDLPELKAARRKVAAVVRSERMP